MKILLTNISLDAERGAGTAERTRRLARHLAAQGQHVSVVVMQGGDLAEELREMGIPVYVTGSVRAKFTIPLLRPGLLGRLVRESDAIHILGYWNLLSVATAWRARAIGRPYVLSGAGEFAGIDRRRPINRIFHRLLGRRMISGAASIVAITPLERSFIVARLGVKPEKVVVVPNGVEELQIDYQGTDVGLPKGKFILFMGRLAPIKGPDLLLDAFAKVSGDFPDLTLVFAGPDSGVRSQLHERVAELKLGGSVVFTGFLNEAARQVAYQRCLFLAVPSRSEAMSLVALEAGMAGKAVLLTDQCGFDVEACAGGMVVPASVAGLEAGLRTMMSAETDLVETGARLQSFVREQYSWPEVVRGLISHLKSQLEGRAKPAELHD